MRRALAIGAVLASLLLLLVAVSALAQDQWPPPEVTVQPHADRGPMPVDPHPPPASDVESPPDSASGGWGLSDYAGALGTLLAAFAVGIGSGAGGYHLTCRAHSLTLSRGPMDWDALVARLDRIESLLEAIQPGNQPSRSPPSRNRKPPALPPAPPTLSPEDPP